MRTVDEAGKLGRAFRLGLAFAFGKRFCAQGVASDEARWITVHPNGRGTTSSGDKAKGQPVLIDGDTGEVLGGMGGKFNGRHISAVPKRGKQEQHGAQQAIEYRKQMARQRVTTPLTDDQKSLIETRYRYSQINAHNFENEFRNFINKNIKPEDPFFNIQKFKYALDRYVSFANDFKKNMDVFLRHMREDQKVSDDHLQKFEDVKKIYDNVNVLVQNVYKKDTKIAEDRKKQIEKQGLNPETIAGVSIGSPSNPVRAVGAKDSPNTNPNYASGLIYKNNCQTCVVAMEARIRGYANEAQGLNDFGKKLSYDSRLAWIDPKTGRFPDYIEIPRGTTYRNLEKRLNNLVEDNARYTIQWGWGRSNDGHIVSLFKTDGKILVIDPQSGDQYDSKEFVEWLRSYGASVGSI